MKVFFVGDNRTALNWGRGASLALSQLLSHSFQITGRITGDFFVLGTAEVGYVNTLLPARYYPLFLRLLNNRKKRRAYSWYLKLERLLGARDFISEDPSESVDSLLARKDRYPALARIHEQASEADALVLDGDGDIIFSTPPRRETLFLLAMIELGLRLKKNVFLVNSMISDCPLTGRNARTLATARSLFAQCRAVALRDPESLEYVQKEMPGVNGCYIPDSLFAWFSRYQEITAKPPLNGDFFLPHPEKDEYWGKLDFSKPYICIGGGALAASQPERSVQCYGRLIDAIRELGHQVYLTENDTPDAFLQQVGRDKNVGVIPVDAPILMCGSVLANARLFISGRYHPSIFASLGGTPCIFLGSHGHKMGSLARVLEYDNQQQFNAFPDSPEVSKILSLVQAYLNQGETLRAKIKRVAKMQSEKASSLPGFIQQNSDAPFECHAGT
jgi:polysaccharide pyruvyl transferase WcaK-like protein